MNVVIENGTNYNHRSHGRGIDDINSEEHKINSNLYNSGARINDNNRI
jgi:hypothetical protein